MYRVSRRFSRPSATVALLGSFRFFSAATSSTLPSSFSAGGGRGLFLPSRVARMQFRQSDKKCNYFDSSTWPSDLDVATLERMLKPHLLDPQKPLKYESLQFMLQMADFDTINIILRANVRPPVPDKVDAEAYLNKHLSNNNDAMSMSLVGRDDHIESVRSALWLQTIVPKRFVVWMSSMRGSGKTQFLERCVHSVFKSRLEHGRVIVRCCDKASGSVWMTEAGLLNEKSALCLLIWEHLREVIHYTGPHFTRVEAAYKTWMEETGRFYKIPQDSKEMDPIILLDTCEVLSAKNHPTREHSETRTPYTMLEAFALQIPAPYGCIVVGCNAGIRTSSLVLSCANVTPLQVSSEVHMETCNRSETATKKKKL